ncbi:MAG: hypothetical protein U0796_10030 [Gemmatales bacterium]
MVRFRWTLALLAGVGLCGGLVSQTVPADKEVVAHVNGVPITRQQLADELIARKGRAQLEALVHRTLIEQTCKSKGITLTDKEVNDELIAEMKASASANLLDFEKSMLSPRKSNLLEYREDVIKPRLLIQKLASAQLTVNEDDLRREFASKYGEKVAIRMIQCKDSQMAKKIWGEIGGRPQMFIHFAKLNENPDLAASAGMLTPFGRHTTHDLIEKRAFDLKEGEISEVLQMAEKVYVIIMKEHDLPAKSGVSFESCREELKASALEKKRQVEVPKIVKQIKDQASTQIQIYLGQDKDNSKLLEKYRKDFEKTTDR